MFFYIFFSRCLCVYAIVLSYNMLNYSDLFANFTKIKMFSIKQFYLFLVKLKMDFPYYIFYSQFMSLTKKLRSDFFSFNINFFVDDCFYNYKLTS
jgi:hypothetical protein